MNKIILIIKREFLTRVRKRTFIIGTILFPLLYLGLIFGTGYIADKSKEDLSVAVIDKSGYFTEAALAKLNQDDTLNKLTLVNVPEDILRDRYDSLGYNGYVVIPATLDWRKGLDSLSFNTNKTYGIGATVPVERKLNRLWDEIKNDSLGIDAGKKTILATSKINLKILNIKNRAAD
ncbi:MAG TPA: ABC transporter permease, partial [Ferruginibacter sp.]|nr:ABC transporter permease [Ferruginibacter sp.]